MRVETSATRRQTRSPRRPRRDCRPRSEAVISRRPNRRLVASASVGSGTQPLLVGERSARPDGYSAVDWLSTQASEQWLSATRMRPAIRSKQAHRYPFRAGPSNGRTAAPLRQIQGSSRRLHLGRRRSSTLAPIGLDPHERNVAMRTRPRGYRPADQCDRPDGRKPRRARRRMRGTRQRVTPFAFTYATSALRLWRYFRIRRWLSGKGVHPGGLRDFWDASELHCVRSGSGVVDAAGSAGLVAGGSSGVDDPGVGCGDRSVCVLCGVSAGWSWSGGV